MAGQIGAIHPKHGEKPDFSDRPVQLLGPCQKESWCNVSGDAVPGGSGGVWGALDF
jgi:hypothetical protein